MRTYPVINSSVPMRPYVLLGWFFPLLLAALLGGVVGGLLWREPKQEVPRFRLDLGCGR